MSFYILIHVWYVCVYLLKFTLYSMGPHHGFPERPSAARPSRQLLAMIHVLQVAQLVQQNLVEEILVGVDGPHTPFEDGLHICEPWCWYIHDVCWYICHYLPTFFWCFFFAATLGIHIPAPWSWGLHTSCVYRMMLIWSQLDLIRTHVLGEWTPSTAKAENTHKIAIHGDNRFRYSQHTCPAKPDLQVFYHLLLIDTS